MDDSKHPSTMVHNTYSYRDIILCILNKQVDYEARKYSYDIYSVCKLHRTDRSHDSGLFEAR